MATGCSLHLVHPLGFSTDERALRRAGLDYWPRLDVTEHASWADFVQRELCVAATHTHFQSTLALYETVCFSRACVRSPRGLRDADANSPADARPAPWLLTTHARAERHHWEASFAPGDYLLFGSETRGAADEVHAFVGEERRIALPMVADARSINLAAAVSGALFEAIRQVERAQS